MALNTRHFFLSVVYATALSWLLLNEIVPRWSYMNYRGEFSGLGLAVALCASAILGLSVPHGKNTRAMIVACLNYMFFVPSAVYVSFHGITFNYIFSFLFSVLGVYYISRIRISVPVIASIKKEDAINLCMGFIFVALLAQAYFGGLRYFNLNITRVYEFRSLAASEIPAFFGYISSSVSSVIIPTALIISINFKRYRSSLFIVLLSVILFGMDHHKTTLFVPFILVMLYIFFVYSKQTSAIGIIFILITLFCISEFVYMRYIIDSDGIAYINSYIIRRVIFTPAMLDSIFVNFFSSNEKYYWATSRFGSWAMESPYPVTAPYLIGEKYFSDPSMGANTGMIGSGFSNAGLYGVFLYSMVVGMLISSLNVYGKRIGHATVAAVSLVSVFYVVTTTDLTTAILSHGLLLLLVMLSLFSGPAERGADNGAQTLALPRPAGH